VVQIVYPAAPFDLPVVDLTQYSRPEAEALVERVAFEEAHWPFNPVLDPALRAAVLKIAPEEHILLITLNHLLADDVSWGLLLADLGQAYDGLKAGLPVPLPALSIQFADYVCWLGKWLGSAESARQEAYWRRQLSEPLAPLDLPTSHPRGESLSWRFRRHRRRLPDALYGKLQSVARTLGVTVFMVMLSTFKLFLLRRTGQEDIRVGTLMTLRNKPALQPLIGPFITTLVLRTDLSGNPRFSEVLARVQRTVVDAFANCDLPLDRIVAAAAPHRNLRRDPLFRIFVIFQQLVEEQWQSGDLRVAALTPDKTLRDETEIASYELICEIEARSATLDVIFRYNADVFDDPIIESFMADFESLLVLGLSDPRLRVEALLASAQNGV
jgi:Condensation domain